MSKALAQVCNKVTFCIRGFEPRVLSSVDVFCFPVERRVLVSRYVGPNINLLLFMQAYAHVMFVSVERSHLNIRAYMGPSDHLQDY